MRGIFGIDPGWGITIVRVTLAVIFIVAGAQKFSTGMDAVATNFEKMAIPAPGIAGPFIVGLELVGGALLLLGVAGRWLGLLFAIQFVIATFYVKFPGQGFGAARLDLVILAGSLLVFIAGPGRAAVDSFWLERPRSARHGVEDVSDVRRVA
jgi:putative oxidoreductase